MKTVGIRALKQNASAVVAEAAAGETITVTDRGRPVARVVPLASSRIGELIESGRLRPARRSLADLGPAVPAQLGPSALSDLIRVRRADERY